MKTMMHLRAAVAVTIGILATGPVRPAGAENLTFGWRARHESCSGVAGSGGR